MDVHEIPLPDGKIAIVSPEDAERLNRYKWHSSHHSSGITYAARRDYRTGKRIFMHREIMSPPDDMEIDHINDNGLDNRRENLRICTRQQNAANARSFRSTKYRGVQPSGNRWRAVIHFNGERYIFGPFDTPEEAARAYDEAALDFNKDFARLNFPASRHIHEYDDGQMARAIYQAARLNNGSGKRLRALAEVRFQKAETPLSSASAVAFVEFMKLARSMRGPEISATEDGTIEATWHGRKDCFTLRFRPDGVGYLMHTTTSGSAPVHGEGG